MKRLSERLSLIAPLQDSTPFALGSMRPIAALTPPDASSIAATLALLAEEGGACVPWGGGCRQEMGFLPARYDVALSAANLTRLVDLQPGDLTVTAEAGMTLAHLQSLLAEHGQFVALESPYPQRETIGGLLATGGSALLRYAYGAPRDQVIGIAAAMPNGAVVRAGGRVVKNVAGYDLCKLFTGSMGTLGVLVEATFRVRPLPPSLRTWAGLFPSASAVDAALATLMDSALQPTFVQAVDPGALLELGPLLPVQALCESECWALCLGADGHEQLSRWTAEEADRLMGPVFSAVLGGAESASLRDTLVRRCAPDFDSSALCLRLSVLPSETLILMDQCRQHLQDGNVFCVSAVAAAGNGVIYLNLTATPGVDANRVADSASRLLEWIEETVAGMGGVYVILRCPPRLRESGAKMWGRSAPTEGLMRRIRQQLDPHLVLNRGRLFNDEEDASAV